MEVIQNCYRKAIVGSQTNRTINIFENFINFFLQLFSKHDIKTKFLLKLSTIGLRT